MQLRDQEKNLQTYLNNMPYEQRHPVYNHLMQFVTGHQNFWIRSSVQNKGDQFYSYIEIVGFIAVGKNMIELRIMIPHNYPLAMPEFDLVYDSQSYEIVRLESLLANNVVALRRNMANQELIRLNYQSVRRVWMKAQTRNIGCAFNQIAREINTPALMIRRQAQKMRESVQMVNSMKNLGGNRNKSALTQHIYSELQSQIITLLDKQGQVQTIKQESDYKEARVDFFQRNAPRLEKMMKTVEANITKELCILRTKHEEILVKDSLDPILVMKSEHEDRLQVLAKHDAMKEAERKLVQSIETAMNDLKISYEDQKGVIRQFYEQMFDCQLQYLKNCK